MPNPLAAHPHWRQVLVLAVLLPVVVVAAILAFAFPAARTAPRELPIGVVGTGPGTSRLAANLDHERPGAFDLHLYGDSAAARTAIRHRDVYGAFVVGPDGVTVLTAGAAGPAVAQLLGTAEPGARVVDVVPMSSGDPRGTVLSSAVLPLTLCAVLTAVAITLLVRLAPAWRQLVAVTVIAGTAALGALLIAQGFLGALPGEHLATWAALALVLGAMTAAVCGLVGLAGPAGLGLGAAVMIFVGNPFSAATSAPELLPTAIGHLGQWLPPGAGVSLLRSTAYFHGQGAWPHVAVLSTWAVLGALAVLVGGRKIRPVADVAPEVDAHSPADDGPGAVRPVLVNAGRHEQRG